MSERVSDAAYRIMANSADDPESAQVLQEALIAPGD